MSLYAKDLLKKILTPKELEILEIISNFDIELEEQIEKMLELE